VIQAWTNAIYRAEKWVKGADATEAAKLAAPFFPKVPLDLLVDSVKRYREIGIWKTDPATHPPAIEKLQDILVEGGVLKKADRVSFESIVDNRFAEKAKATIR
jgi:NitT/TauT family transport system substrate-binding protein